MEYQCYERGFFIFGFSESRICNPDPASNNPSQSISNSQCLAKIQRIFYIVHALYAPVHAPTAQLYLKFLFLLINSSSSDLMSYCILAIEFLALKYYTNSLFYQFFLSHSDFFFSLIPSVASFFFSPLILSFSSLQLLLFFS